MKYHPVAARRVGWFLVVSYAFGAALVLYLETTAGTLSNRFALPPFLIQATSIVQILCAGAIALDLAVVPAAAILTVLSIGAVGAHLRIESPMTATPAVLTSALQIWFILQQGVLRSDRSVSSGSG